MDSAILTVLVILAATVVTLAAGFVSLEVAALLCMLALAWSGALTPQEALSGFSSQAVIAMMGVMILGRGIAKTGVMDRFAQAVLNKSGTSTSKVMAIMSLAVGALSGFIQNIGAAALFVPGILHVSRRGRIPPSTLIMPVGFAAILGGTLSMVGSGPLILVNDLLRGAGLAPYRLFDVTPAGVLLLVSGTAFFLLLGRVVLPVSARRGAPVSEQEKLVAALRLPRHIGHYAIPRNSALAGKTAEQSGAWSRFGLHVLGIARSQDVEYAPWRETRFATGQELALLGREEDAAAFAAAHGLVPGKNADPFAGLQDPDRVGFAEIIVPYRSQLAGQTLRRFALRRRYAVEPVMLFSKGEEVRGDFSDRPILPGDTIIVHGRWEKISDLKASADFVVVTPFAVENRERSKTGAAAFCFLGAVGLALAGAPIALAFFSGALAMVLLGVLTIEEAQQAIGWKVVFLLAGLMPLGIAMQKSGAAAFLAHRVMALAHGGHLLGIILAVAALSTLFSLFMSNVGAIVVLAPLVMNMALIGGIDPRPLALLAAVCTANSFILPTHQVNALLMPAGGYRPADYVKAGSGMTLVFLFVAVLVFYFLYF
jgi:di/tricarboxylate transporter